MSTPQRTYWRIDPASQARSKPCNLMKEPADFVKGARVGDGVVWAYWDGGLEQGQVSAIGIVKESTKDSVVVEWRHKAFPIKAGAGADKWETLSVFKFAKNVIKARNLQFHFDLAFRGEA